MIAEYYRIQRRQHSLLTLVYYSLARRLRVTGGILGGVSFGLKLYGGPLFLYFAAKRNGKALAGMAMSFAASNPGALAVRLERCHLLCD